MADGKLTIVTRLPNEVFRAKLDSYVKKRKESTPAYSMNQMVLDALRMLADGPRADPPIQVWPQPSHELKVSGFGQPERTITVEEQRKAIEMARAAEAPFGKSVTDHLVSRVKNQPSVSVAQPKATARPWLPELVRIQALYEFRGEDGTDEYAAFTRGMALPPEYRSFQPGDKGALAKRAEKLDLRYPLPPLGDDRPEPAAPAADGQEPDAW